MGSHSWMALEILETLSRAVKVESQTGSHEKHHQKAWAGRHKVPSSLDVGPCGSPASRRRPLRAGAPPLRVPGLRLRTAGSRGRAGRGGAGRGRKRRRRAITKPAGCEPSAALRPGLPGYTAWPAGTAGSTALLGPRRTPSVCARSARLRQRQRRPRAGALSEAPQVPFGPYSGKQGRCVVQRGDSLTHTPELEDS